MAMELSDQELNQVSDVIAALDEHNFNEQVSEALADLISKVQTQGTKGTLTIKLIIEPVLYLQDQIRIIGEYQMTPPKHQSNPTKMRSVNPDQLTLFQWVETEIIDDPEDETHNAEDEITSEDYRPEPARKQLAAV